MSDVLKTAKRAYDRTKQIDENTKKKVERAKPGERVALNDKEATSHLLHNHLGDNVQYHNDEMERKLGYESQTYLVKDKNGNVTYTHIERSGGFYYLGDLLTVIVLLVAAGATTYGIYDTYMKGDTLNMGLALILAPILCFLAVLAATKSLIPSIKEKLEYKKGVKEGTIKKRRLGLGMLTSRVMIIDILLIMGIGLYCLINQILGGEDNPCLIYAFLVLGIIFVATGIVKVIHGLILMIITLKKEADNVKAGRY